MLSFLRRSALWFAPALNTKTLAHLTRRYLLVPSYHVVSNERLPHVAHLYGYHGVGAFESGLDMLLRYFDPIDIDKLVDVVSGRKRLRRPVCHLTFDDGMRQVFDLVAPILLRRGLPATAFVNPAFVDNRELFYRHKASLIIEAISENRLSKSSARRMASVLGSRSDDASDLTAAVRCVEYFNRATLDECGTLAEVDFRHYLSTERPYVTSAELRAWQRTGFAVGAHSIDHPDFKRLCISEQLRQTRESVEYVSVNYPAPCRLFAFPFSDTGVSRSFFSAVFDPTRPMLDVSFGVSGLKSDWHPRHVHRVPMEVGPMSARRVINREYVDYAIAAARRRNRIRRDD